MQNDIYLINGATSFSKPHEVYPIWITSTAILASILADQVLK
jgi:hypothetical protein